MHTQRTAPIESRPEEATARNGVVVAGGYGLRIFVERGQLQVDDGFGTHRRSRSFHRATSGLRRLVVLGHTGYVSLEALRWLADLRAAYLQIDADGRVLATFGPPGTDRPALRRAQAMATQTDQALLLSRWLVDAKLAGQIVTLRRFADRIAANEPIAVIEAYRHAAAEARTPEDLRSCEAWAAGAYWQALAPLEVRFARRDVERVPSHWRTFGGRSSPIANGPRMAANPANAVVSYCYALLEAEATRAARIVGLDAGLGIMHADQAHRDSLSCDLMEPIRPLVDAYAFELLTSRPFAARDFHETRTGVCRVVAPLTHELAETLPRWRELVGRVAEDFAAELGTGDAPTLITGRRRAARGPNGARARSPKRKPSARRACSWCGRPALPRRATCSDACAERVLAETHQRFAAASSERMRQLAKEPEHPALSADANEKRRATRKAQRAAELEWEREHPGLVDPMTFATEIAPKLADKSARAISQATGLSVSYCAEIKNGERVPHPTWWTAIASVLRPIAEQSPGAKSPP